MSWPVSWRDPAEPSEAFAGGWNVISERPAGGYAGHKERSGSKASSSASSSAQVRASSPEEEGVWHSESFVPENLEEQFEEDFNQHLRRRNKVKRLTCGAVGAVGGGVIGFAASPLVLPGLAIAALVGGAGGYQWAKTKGKAELRKHSRADTEVSEDIQMPTLRRLKYLAKWGHWQLLDYADAPAEWRCTVLDEVVKAFFPWVQRMHYLHETESTDGTEKKEVLQCLMPLYLFLQRRAVREALFSASTAATEAFDACNQDEVALDRCQFLFPIVLDTVVATNRLDPKLFELLVRGTSQRRQSLFSAQREPRHSRLQPIITTLRRILEREDVKVALESAVGSASASASPDRPCIESLLSFLEPANSPPPLVVPPEGVEDEPGLVTDGPSDDENAFLSCDSDEEPAAGGEAKPPARRPAGLPPSKSRSSRSGANCATSFEERASAFPKGEGNHTWQGFPEDTFDIRSETYLRDRKKIPSGPAMFEPVSVEIVRVGPEGPVWRVGKHKDFFPAYQRKRGDKRFFIVHNWVFPPYQAILIGALDPEALWQQNPDCPQGRLWRRFLDMEPEQRKDIFKVIISINEGPWLVKRAAPKKPILIGKKVKTEIFYEPHDHLEFVMDISTGKAEQMAVGIVMKALRGLQVSIATLLEATHDEELPETLLFCGAVRYMDLDKSSYPRSEAEMDDLEREGGT